MNEDIKKNVELNEEELDAVVGGMNAGIYAVAAPVAGVSASILNAAAVKASANN